MSNYPTADQSSQPPLNENNIYSPPFVDPISNQNYNLYPPTPPHDHTSLPMYQSTETYATHSWQPIMPAPDYNNQYNFAPYYNATNTSTQVPYNPPEGTMPFAPQYNYPNPPASTMPFNWYNQPAQLRQGERMKWTRAAEACPSCRRRKVRCIPLSGKDCCEACLPKKPQPVMVLPPAPSNPTTGPYHESIPPQPPTKSNFVHISPRQSPGQSDMNDAPMHLPQENQLRNESHGIALDGTGKPVEQVTGIEPETLEKLLATATLQIADLTAGDDLSGQFQIHPDRATFFEELLSRFIHELRDLHGFEVASRLSVRQPLESPMV